MDFKESRRQFGENLKSARKELGVTQEQLAEMVERSTEHISFLERGERAPSFELILEIAYALQIPATRLMQIENTLKLETRYIERVSMGDVPPPSKRALHFRRLRSAWDSIGDIQKLAQEYGIEDIFQDNGGKLLQVLVIAGLKKLPSREGNDAIDDDNNEYELKTVNIALSRSVTTHHHLNLKILEKYRHVKAWIIALYEGIELKEIYRVDPLILEPLFQQWEKRIVEQQIALNNPKINLDLYVRKGVKLYPFNE